MLALLANPFARLVAGAALAATLLLSAYGMGKHDQRIKTEQGAARDALARLERLEKNNADFSKLDARGKCLVFMLDSGLPVSACD